ncbi:glutathione S-transferase T3-like [Asparagus officinalis]|uniref:glutathione S-transferase T3-like n=1 Tax=Asparagus officinalis TaxID=4686 RepID=UPI00098DFA3A|nr:glutathione S-transferase T3-like [Asparagus officinalis]
MQPQNPNTQRPENHPYMPYGYQNPNMMPPIYGMQYPYNHPYMPYGYQPVPGNSSLPSHVNFPNIEPTSEPNTPRFSSGSTDIPQFSTQISLGELGGDTPHSFEAPTQQSAKKGNYASWTFEENKLLLTGYFHYSTDSELGSNQKGDTFWGKISDYVNENSDRGIQRNIVKCQSHFRDLNKKISNFVGCYSAATRERRSGWSDNDYISKGLELYSENQGTKFQLLDEWKLVRHQPKYITGATESGSSGSKRKSGSDDVDSAIHSLVRPEGRDATKKKARASSSKSSTSRKSKVTIDKTMTTHCITLQNQ